jgi:hypothetical protein
MNKKTVQLYASENVLEAFYQALIDNNPRAFRRVHIPKSDVFYIREAIKCNTGVQYTLDHVERALYLEGWLSKHEVLDPNRKREYG